MLTRERSWLSLCLRLRHILSSHRLCEEPSKVEASILVHFSTRFKVR